MTQLTVGTLLSADGYTTDGSTPVLIGAFLPTPIGESEEVWVVSAMIHVSGIDDVGNTASAIIAVTANLDVVAPAFHLLNRTDVVPIRTGSSLALQGCQVQIQVNNSGVNVYVID